MWMFSNSIDLSYLHLYVCVITGAGECRGRGEPGTSGAAVRPQGAGGDSG